jgi:FtsP/CotA-like multicopper oxidase with cupredoxin domain
MGHCTPKPATPAAGSGNREGTAVAAAAGPGALPYPKVDYGYGSDPMAGMDHSAMGHTGMAMPLLGQEGDTDGSGRVFGWATGAPYGARVLSMRDLEALAPKADARAPTREISIKVQGNMERYIWMLNGAKFGDAPPIRVGFNERVRVTFVNETMMAHPMHLHGMFFQVENGQPMDRMPEKNVIVVAPGKTQSILLTANEAGEWPLHCHLLYHMDSGMMQKLIVASVDRPDGTPAPAAGHGHH